MAFRRQDIPKSTRKADDGGPRRLYPRFARDHALLPKIELAIGYLDGMVGRKRADLSPDVILDLFGDPKLARCLLNCLADSYRYRTPEFAEVIGEDAALALTGWDLINPMDLRRHVYRAANTELGGFVPDDERPTFLVGVARPLGLDAGQLDALLHLDAERNAVLIRVGPRPKAEDVVARYNVYLTLSVLRHASAVTLHLPGLPASTVETVCSRHEVGWRRKADGQIRLTGRRSATGSWVRFGSRLARCALQLIALCPEPATGEAMIHLTDQPLAFVLDAKVVGYLRPKLRAVAGPGGIIQTAMLADDVAALRRKSAGSAHGWTLRRLPDPIVVDGALVLPELTFTRDQTTFAVASVTPGSDRALAALAMAHRAKPVVALGVGSEAGDVPAIGSPDGEMLLDLLDRQDTEADGMRTPLGTLTDELAIAGWVPMSRLDELFGGPPDPASHVRPLTADGDVVLVAGFGLCRLSLLDDLLDRVTAGPVDVSRLRSAAAALVGEGPGADALTLHILSRQPLLTHPQTPGSAQTTDQAA